MPKSIAKRVIVSLSSELLEFLESPRFGGQPVPIIIRQFIVDSKAFAEHYRDTAAATAAATAKGAKHVEPSAPRKTTTTVAVSPYCPVCRSVPSWNPDTGICARCEWVAKGGLQ
jgi:hypothetical protein